VQTTSETIANIATSVEETIGVLAETGVKTMRHRPTQPLHQRQHLHHQEMRGMLDRVALAESLPTRQTSPTPTLHPHLDEDTATKNVPVQPGRIPMTRMTSTTRLVDPKMTVAVTVMATSQKAINPTDDAEIGTHTTTTVTAVTSLAATGIGIEIEIETVTADTAMTDMTTDTTTCSTANRAATLATMIEIATGEVATAMTTATAIVAEAVGMGLSLESPDNRNGRGRPWTCSRTTRSLSSRKRVSSTSRNRWRMASEDAKESETEIV